MKDMKSSGILNIYRPGYRIRSAFLKISLLATLSLVSISSFASGLDCRAEFFLDPAYVHGLAKMPQAYEVAGNLIKRSGPFQNDPRIMTEFERFMPNLDQTKSSNLASQLQIYADYYLREFNLHLDPNPILSRGSRVYFLKDVDGVAVFVIKIFPAYHVTLLNELSTGQILTQIKSQYFRFVGIRDVFNMKINGATHPVMLADAARGVSFSKLLDIRSSGAELVESMKLAARGFFEFHHAQFRTFDAREKESLRAYDLSQTKKYIQSARLTATNDISRTQANQLREKLLSIADQAYKNSFPFMTYKHGDAHVENVFFDGGGISFIDYMSGEWGFKRSANDVIPAGDPLEDVGRFLESWRLQALERGGDQRTIAATEDAFIQTYAKLWNMPASSFADAVLSHRLRFSLVRLDDFGGLTSDHEKSLIVRDLFARFGN